MPPLTLSTFLGPCRGWLLVLSLSFLTPNAEAKLNVVVTLPDIAAVAQQVGGDLVQLTTLARPNEDPHFIDPKPSFIRILNKAELLIHGGAELENSWLPSLVQTTRNPKILSGGSGLVDASSGLQLLQKNTGNTDRASGDVHLSGNPHYLLSPDFVATVATNITRAFASADRVHESNYATNLAKFITRLQTKQQSWRATLQSGTGSKVITYHHSFDYLLSTFNYLLVDTIEPKPGIEPSPTHITTLIRKHRETGVKYILIEPNRGRKTPQRLAEILKAEVIVLPLMPGAVPNTDDYFLWMDYLVTRIAPAP